MLPWGTCDFKVPKEPFQLRGNFVFGGDELEADPEPEGLIFGGLRHMYVY